MGAEFCEPSQNLCRRVWIQARSPHTACIYTASNCIVMSWAAKSLAVSKVFSREIQNGKVLKQDSTGFMLPCYDPRW